MLERLLAVLRGAAGDPPQGDARERLLARWPQGAEVAAALPALTAPSAKKGGCGPTPFGHNQIESRTRFEPARPSRPGL